MSEDDDGRCFECNGSGEVEYDSVDYRGEHTTKTEECSQCGGSGSLVVDSDEYDEYQDVDWDDGEEIDWESPQ